MRPILLYRLVFPALFLTLLLACKENSPYDVNRSVRPNDFLSGEEYTSLTVEIVYVEGLQPTGTTVQALKTFLATLLNKPAGINVIERSIPSPGASIYDVDLLRQLEFENRSVNTEDDRLTAYIFFADGEYANNSEDSKILGVAYDYSSLTIFAQTIRDNSGGPGKPSTAKLETTSIYHEFGHILGLVNNGTPLQSEHQDPAHDGHCDNEECLMYHRVESTDIVSDLFGTSTPTLDANCRADLVANGGK